MSYKFVTVKDWFLIEIHILIVKKLWVLNWLITPDEQNQIEKNVFIAGLVSALLRRKAAGSYTGLSQL